MVGFLNNFDKQLSLAYDAALKSGELIFTPSEHFTTKETEHEIECVISYAPALSKKPHGILLTVEQDPKPKFDRPSTPVAKKVEKINPFLPHSPALYVTDASEEHKILLNKYCIVPRHYLVVTKVFESQTDPLTPDDLMAVWNTLTALQDSQDAVAFYNCGTRSGASQPHKHMQVIPLEKPSPIAQLVREHVKARPGKKKNRPGDIFSVAFNCINHVILLPNASNTDKSQEDILTEAYITLVDAMIMSIRESAEQEDLMDNDQPPSALKLSSTLAYNWLLTKEFMAIVPRKHEKTHVVNGISLDINSLGFAGLVLAKTSKELAIVKEKGVIALASETGYSAGWEKRTPEQEQKRREELAALEQQMGNALSIFDAGVLAVVETEVVLGAWIEAGVETVVEAALSGAETEVDEVETEAVPGDLTEVVPEVPGV
ncbi:bifunctional AP-4-A phosphorylase/ADP sulfurylase [Modicella reniformis]|uniref:Bifunctional AP-4-A phosphorylase/ADP sulfurylase n=1 Tax=Modicella reniformis TaxID=1440133 RepID=A0A9P6J2C7_9FUNG|nr:bifunctional AP-4-A phosphorylase/ADP sulfurylase [Modicella reniformis]